MDEVVYGNLLKYISFITGICGTLVGLDLVLGARVISLLKKILDRGTDIIDKSIASAQSKRLFGFVILALSLVILFLGKNIKM